MAQGERPLMNLDESKYSWLKSGGWGFRLKVGVAHKATRHVNFDCKVRSFAGVLYRAAASVGMKATIQVFEKQGTVVFSFYRPDSLSRPNLNAYPIVRRMRMDEERL